MKRFIGRIRNQELHGHPPPECHEHYQVLWRGYIANRAELLTEAGHRGIAPTLCSEGALFARAYAWWGAALPSHVLGEYAVAIFDRRSGLLFLAHDGLGLVPLFYGALPGGLLFASHLEDLVVEEGVGELDDQYIADYLADLMCRGERTPYRHFRRLCPGQTVTWRPGRLVKRRAWDLAEVRPAVLAGTHAYEERLRDLLREGVTAALGANGPVWSECSGGLDSSTVTCVAARSGAKNLAAMSIVFSCCGQADETPWIQEVLDLNPMPWHRLDGDGCLPYSRFPERFFAEPNLAMINWHWHQRYEEVLGAHGVEALLTGQGGDHVFLGSASEPYYLADRACAGRLDQLITELRRWRQADRYQRSWFFWLANFVIRPAVRHALGHRLRSAGHPGVSPWVHSRYFRAMRSDSWRGSALEGRTIGEQWFQENLYSLCAVISSLNQTPAAFEYRHPLLYRPLVEFMYAIPWEAKLRPGSDRYLQRRALQGVLPEKIRLRRDKGASNN